MSMVSFASFVKIIWRALLKRRRQVDELEAENARLRAALRGMLEKLNTESINRAIDALKSA
jgi:hypothetical protein